jgi:hypothetical protein
LRYSHFLGSSTKGITLYKQPQKTQWYIPQNKDDIFCNRWLQSNNNYYDTHSTTLLNFLTKLIFVFSLYHCTSMTWIVITVFFIVKDLTEDGQKRPKYVAGLPHVSILLYLITVQLLEYVWWLVLLHRTWKI